MAAQYDEAASDRNMEFESVSPLGLCCLGLFEVVHLCMLPCPCGMQM